jgi:hypothetical protein
LKLFVVPCRSDLWKEIRHPTNENIAADERKKKRGYPATTTQCVKDKSLDEQVKVQTVFCQH